MSAQKSSSGGPGCVVWCAAALILWAFLFGVTWNGKHHQIGCSCERGIEVR